jgi:uncharacterized protein DUF2628
MSLAPCRECGKEVSTEAPGCPHCGVPHPTMTFAEVAPYYRTEFQRIRESNEAYKGQWNWAAFFFGPLWALTKGVWLAPAICLGLGLITHGVAAIGYWFVFGARGNYMYYCAHTKNQQIAV